MEMMKRMDWICLGESVVHSEISRKEMNNATIIAFVPILLLSVMNSNSLPFVNLFNCPIHFDPFLSHCVHFFIYDTSLIVELLPLR